MLYHTKYTIPQTVIWYNILKRKIYANGDICIIDKIAFIIFGRGSVAGTFGVLFLRPF